MISLINLTDYFDCVMHGKVVVLLVCTTVCLKEMKLFGHLYFQRYATIPVEMVGGALHLIGVNVHRLLQIASVLQVSKNKLLA